MTAAADIQKYIADPKIVVVTTVGQKYITLVAYVNSKKKHNHFFTCEILSIFSLKWFVFGIRLKNVQNLSILFS